MPISKVKASKRAKKGWITRRRQDPSRYRDTKIKKTGRHHTWTRPNKQQIKLKKFSDQEIERIKPVLMATDKTLKKNVELHNLREISKKGVGNDYARYTSPPEITFGDKSYALGKARIHVNPKVFNKRSKVNPQGIIAHEIGHSVFPGMNSKHSISKYKDFQESFGYKVPKKSHAWETEKYTADKGSPFYKRQGKTRQSENANEDFAESFRAFTGASVNSNQKYWSNVHIDQKRANHLFKNYIDRTSI